MNILLIGANGMLGRAVYRQIQQRNLCSFTPSRLQCDIAFFPQIEKWVLDHEITHIINCAAYTNVDEAENNPNLAYQINAKGVENLGKIARQERCKVVHFSTDYVFNGEKKEPYREEDPPAAINVYGKTKLQGEILLQEQTDQCLIIRTSWLFGLDKEHFILKMKTLMEREKEIQVVSDQIGKPTFCEDLAAVSLDLLPFCGVFHFANSPATSWYEYACFIHQQIPHPFCEKIIPVSSKHFNAYAQRPKYSVLSTEKLEKTLKVIPKSWKKGVQVYLEEALC